MTTNSQMVKHQIEIREILVKTVEVELPYDKLLEARHLVMDRYHNGDIVLTEDDYYDTEFYHNGTIE